jgi:hypothetical protein
MNKWQYVIISIVWFTAATLFSLTFWVAVIQPALDPFVQHLMDTGPQTRSPLGVYFRFPNNTAIPQYGFVDSNNTRVTFQLPPNAHIQFTYSIMSLGPRDPLENVTLYFDQVSEKLALLGLANQSYPLPFEINVGTININLYKDYGAIIETPAEKGTYEMQWNVTSNQISYSFKIIIKVAD